MTPDLLTIAEVAKLLKMSRKAVLRRFKNMPGVIDLGSPETKTKRGYQILRIPRPAVEKYLLEHTR
jgi:hypothetical protein